MQRLAQIADPNLACLTVTDRLEALGCNPIVGMARIAMDETAGFENPGTDVRGTKYFAGDIA